MQSAAPDTSRQKQASTAFSHPLIQFLSACLSVLNAPLFIQESAFFSSPLEEEEKKKKKALSLIRIYFALLWA